MSNEYEKYHFNNYYVNPIVCGNILIYQLGEMLCDPGKIIPYHEQRSHEFTYVTSGECDIFHGNDSVRAKKGDLILSMTGEKHKISAIGSEPLRYSFVSFGKTNDDDIFGQLIGELERLFKKEGCRIVPLHSAEELFFDMFSELESKKVFHGEMIALRMTELLAKFIRKYTKVNVERYSPRITYSSSLAYQVRNYISKNVCDIKSLRDLEKEFNYNIQYIAKCFKNTSGKTLNKFFIEEKMRYADNMLSGGMSVTQVSEKLGYSSIHVFSRRYKEFFGYSPKKRG